MAPIEPVKPSKKEKKLRKLKKQQDANADAAVEVGSDVPAKKGKKRKQKYDSVQNDAGEQKRAVLAEDAVAVHKVKKTKTQKIKPVAETSEWQQQHSVAVHNASFAPCLSFADTGFAASVLQCTHTFERPSPIQAQCWPIITAGRDLVGIAATGSGKTLAFGLPALQRLSQGPQPTGKAPVSVLVLAPTRELAAQTATVLEGAGKSCNVATVCIYGGVSKKEQVAALKRGPQVVVGTPGRIQDLLDDGALKLSAVNYVVLDEADRMLDLGFEPAVRAILNKTLGSRQTLMFSATWPMAVQKLASEFFSNPAKVTIGSQELSANHSVTQVVEVIDASAKESRLLELLAQYHASRKNRVIVFVLYKKEASRMEALLQRKGWKVAAVHGDLSQDQRTKAVTAFKEGSSPLLLATDVAARGLDIPDVEVVINYSFPLTTEDYVHRIGRTGRAGKTGVAHTLFCGVHDKPRAGELINVLREAGQTVPEELLKFGTTVKKKESKLYGAHFKDVDLTKKATKVTFDDSDDE